MLKPELLHLCDSLFPVGSFGYSDGLETAAARGVNLRDWMDVVLDENISQLEGPAVLRAWGAFHAPDWDALVGVDEELTALRPAMSARRSSRAMGLRLLTTWHALH